MPLFLHEAHGGSSVAEVGAPDAPAEVSTRVADASAEKPNESQGERSRRHALPAGAIGAAAARPPARPRIRAERRRYQRYALRCACWLEGQTTSIYATTADVGLGGLFLRSAIPVPRGLSVDVEVKTRDGDVRVLGGGVVTRAVRAKRGQRYGIGVEFTDLEGGEDALLRLLRRQRDE